MCLNSMSMTACHHIWYFGFVYENKDKNDRKIKLKSDTSQKIALSISGLLRVNFKTIIMPIYFSGFVLVIQGRDLLQLKIVKQQYRGSVKRASDLKMKTELYRVRPHIHH